MLPGFAGMVVFVCATVVDVLLVEVLLMVAGAAGGVHFDEGSASHLFSMTLSAPSSLAVTVSSQRVLIVAQVWAYTHQ